MSLRLKALLVFSLTLILLFGVIVALSKAIIEKQFTSIERDRVLHQSERFSLDLQNKLKPVVSVVGDMALRDNLHGFLNGRNPAFEKNSLNDRLLRNLGLDFFVIFRKDQPPLLVETASSHFDQYGVTPQMLMNVVGEAKITSVRGIDQPLSGFLKIGENLALVAAFPVFRSPSTNLPADTIMGGKILTAKAIENAEDQGNFHVKLSLHSLPSTAGVDPNEVTQLLMSKETSTLVPLRDINGNLIATAEIIITNSLHAQAEKTIRIFLIGLASSAGILLFVVWYLLDSTVIYPVQRLATKLTVAAAKGQLPSDLGVSGRDELANLAHRIEDLAHAVTKAEASYRAIVEDQTDFIFRYLPDGHITFVNESLCRYLGKSREQILGMNAKDFVAQEDVRRVADAIGGLSHDRPVVTLDHRLPSAQGEVVWLRRTDRAIFSAAGRLRELQCVACDITQAHLAREQLRASEIRYRRLFETATDGILIIKKSTRTITDANPTLCAMLNSKCSILTDRSIASVPQFKLPQIQSVLSGLMEGESPLRKGEIVLPLEYGLHYLEVTASIYDVEGESVVQLNFHDITARRQASDELRQLSSSLLRSQDDERRRIARELHDSTAQNLSALQMAVAQLDNSIPKVMDKSRIILREIQKLADLSSREIRTISYLLHPPLLDEVGLLFALRWYVDGFITRTEKIVRLDLPDSFDRLQPEIETTIFRVVQEGLSNFHRHSGSRRAWIRLAVEEGAIHLEIRDEGKGFASPSSTQYPPAYPIMGVGIPGMRERLRQFNGSLEIESGGQGTVVRAILPLKPDEATED